MEFFEPALALGKLALIFILILVLLRFKVKLWIAILSGSLITAVLTGLSPAAWPGILFNALTSRDFVILALMVFLILVLSGVQEATGQSRKMVRGLSHYLRSPRLRLVLFPALVGLLPMPGGALFSCPMVKDTARDMGLTEQKKSLINYWFRHIWELAWPLYPGYVLICALLDIPLTRLWLYTFPLVISAFGVGWFFYMRDLDASPAPASAPAAEEPEEKSLAGVLLHGLPIAVVLLGAVIFGFVFSRFLPQLPGQLAFCLSLVVAVGVALYQGRGERMKPLRQIAFTPNVGRIFLLLAAIYVFKDTVAAAGLIASMGTLGSSGLMLVPAFILIPFVSGLLTGLMVGFVGLSFPLLIGIAQQSPLQEYMLPLVVLGMIAGNCGQLLTPVHVCLVVTAEFFSATVPRLLRSLALPVAALGLMGTLWALLLLLFNVRL
ncbi:MAG: DUF401 family protein [Desulfovibrionaceae bacterium]|nr:DUF401 family protein [Desulfovibrionaceae bacterium]